MLFYLYITEAEGSLSNDVYMHLGHTGKIVTRRGLYPVTNIAEAFRKEICLCYQLHMTLQDVTQRVVSSNYRKGTAYNILLKHQGILIPLIEFHSVEVEAGLEAARKVLLLMYEKGTRHKSCDTINELHFQMTISTDKPESYPGLLMMLSRNMHEEQSYRRLFGALVTLQSQRH